MPAVLISHDSSTAIRFVGKRVETGPRGRSDAEPTSHGELITYKHWIDVEIGNQGELFIDGRRTTPSQLNADMATAVRYHTNHEAEAYSRLVCLHVDDNVEWKRVEPVLDAAHKAGDDTVCLD